MRNPLLVNTVTIQLNGAIKSEVMDAKQLNESFIYVTDQSDFVRGLVL